MNPERHESTAAVVRTLKALIEHGGWIPTATLAERAGLTRDSQRRILVELQFHGWVERSSDDGGDRWCVGPELPRIGLAWLALQEAQAQLLRSKLEATLQPFGRHP